MRRRWISLEIVDDQRISNDSIDVLWSPCRTAGVHEKAYKTRHFVTIACIWHRPREPPQLFCNLGSNVAFEQAVEKFRRSARALSSSVQDREYDDVLVDDLIKNSVRKATREHSSNAAELHGVQQCVVSQRRDQKLKLVEELRAEPTSLRLVPSGCDHKIEFGLRPNPDTPSHRRRFNSAKTSSAVRPGLPSTAKAASRRLISASCHCSNGIASASEARLAQISSMRSRRSDTLSWVSSDALGIRATWDTLHLCLAVRKVPRFQNSDPIAGRDTNYILDAFR